MIEKLFWVAIGVLGVKVYNRMKGNLNANSEDELSDGHLDKIRNTLHDYLDDLTEGTASSDEISDRVFEITKE